jgi:hypothetical protein
MHRVALFFSDFVVSPPFSFIISLRLLLFCCGVNDASAATGDFNATASLIDVFVTLHGILSGSNAVMAASFSKKSSAADAQQTRQQQPPPNRSASHTPIAASRKEADSFLSSRQAFYTIFALPKEASHIAGQAAASS